ncbi:MAG: DUF4105 domain-containing protein [Verrucomicrobiota bacterium]
MWSIGAYFYDFPFVGSVWTAAGFLILCIAIVAFLRGGWRAQAALWMLCLATVGWWLMLQPRQFRDWKPGLDRVPRAEVNGGVVTIENVRNFKYHTLKNFDEVWEKRTYDMGELKGVDLFLNYWGMPLIAHPIYSFDFGTGGRICFSMETRQETTEDYSNVAGFYRQYELICVAAEERDVIRLRTNHRTKEDVYLYRLDLPRARRMFLEYVATINALREKPRWYHAITENCTTAVRNQTAAAERGSWDWRYLVSGKLDELFYQRGIIVADGLKFSELKRRARVNDAALSADADGDFSAAIRRDRPGFPSE